jgi:hypothetical protein
LIRQDGYKKVCGLENMRNHANVTLPMFRISDLPDAILLWSPEVYSLAIVHCIISGIGMLGSFVVLLSHVGDKIQPNMLPTLSLVMADFLVLSTTFSVDILNLGKGGWAVGKVGCVAEALMICIGCFSSVFSILASTVERYLHIIHQRSVTSREAWLMVAVVWFVSMVGSWFPLFFGAQDKAYGLNSGLTVCVIAWWDSGAWATSSTVLALVAFLSCVFGMAYCYFRIVYTYFSYSQKVAQQRFTFQVNAISTVWGRSVAQTEGTIASQLDSIAKIEEMNNHQRKEILSQQERVLLTKALILTLTFLVLWSPYFVKFWIELITRRPVPTLFDNLCNMGAATNSCVNWFLLVTLDFRVKRRVYRLFGFGNE